MNVRVILAILMKRKPVIVPIATVIKKTLWKIWSVIAKAIHVIPHHMYYCKVNVGIKYNEYDMT